MTLPSGGFAVRAEREAWAGGRLRVVELSVDGPDGSSFSRTVLRHPGAVAVVPVVDEGDAVLMVRQFRAALGRDLLEIPAGTRDVPGEAPDLTARRELEEEAGMRAGRLEKLAEFYNAPGVSDEHTWVFMALDLVAVEAAATSVEEAHMTVERVAFDAVPGLIASGALMDAKSIIGLCLARDALA